MDKRSRQEMFFPPRVYSGAGSLNKLKDLVSGLGPVCLLFCGKKSLKSSEVLAKITGLLSSAGKSVQFADNITGEPSCGTIDRAASQCRLNSCGFIVAAGGGSVLDAAKAAAAMAVNPGQVREYLEIGQGHRDISGRPLPVIAIPTTAGTGSEATFNAVVTETELKLKRSIRDPLLMPFAALLDPDLTVSLPPDLTAWCGMDALTQLIEPYVSINASPITDGLALTGIKLVFENILKAYKSPGDLEARLAMQKSAFLSGIALANAGLGAAHGFSHPLGALYGLHHGFTCAVLLPHVMAMNIPAVSGKYRGIGILAGGDPSKSAGYLSRYAVEHIIRLNDEMKIPRSLRELGIKKEDARMIAETAMGSSMKQNPIALDAGKAEEFILKLL